MLAGVPGRKRAETPFYNLSEYMCLTRLLCVLRAQVTEHWNIKPGDGFVYFTLRPAWVKKTNSEDLYHPTESQLKNLEKTKSTKQ